MPAQVKTPAPFFPTLPVRSIGRKVARLCKVAWKSWLIPSPKWIATGPPALVVSQMSRASWVTNSAGAPEISSTVFAS